MNYIYLKILFFNSMMIDSHEKILFVTEAKLLFAKPKAIATTSHNKLVFVLKKIIITTQRFIVYQSLANKINETDYELASSYGKKTNKYQHIKSRISVNGYPQFSTSLKGLEIKILKQEDPQIYNYFLKFGITDMIKGMAGHVFLMNSVKKRFYVLSFQDNLGDCYRLGKAIICSQIWQRYQSLCQQQKIEINWAWIKLIHQIIKQQYHVVLIDPDLFISGSKAEIRSFVYLFSLIPFTHNFHYQYAISTSQSAEYTLSLLQMFAQKAYSVSFRQTSITSDNLKLIFNKIKFTNLMKLDLSHNNLEDQIFQTLHKLIKSQAHKLHFLNLCHNNIKFMNPQLFVQLLKLTHTILCLNLSYNRIDDSILQTIEKYVIFAFNPPLEELNLSYNPFAKKVIWRLFVGNLKNFNIHPYLRFIVQPIPIKRQIFLQSDADFPRCNPKLTEHMHSNIIEQINQQSIVKYSFELEEKFKNILILKLKRSQNHNKLPSNKQQLGKALQLSHKLQNFIYQNYSVEKIYNMALQLQAFSLQIPPISKFHFTKFINEKLNEALFVRDHYAIRYLSNCIQKLNIPVDCFKDRLLLVEKRDQIYVKRYESLMNIDIHQNSINGQLDQLVREALRLNLQGNGVQLLYYLKYKRDQYIQKYLYEKFNPEHHLFNLMAKESISTDQAISQKQFIIPYEIRLQKKINENFYLHPWQANYQVLCQMKANDFQSCFEFLQVNDRKDKFSIFFQRIEDRIQFIKNQFSYFVYNKFKASYSDLKINCCRLIYLYNNFKETSIYSQTPFFIRKKMVTQEKPILVNNELWFKRQNHISNYSNLNHNAREANIYNFHGVMTKCQNQKFLGQAKIVISKQLMFLSELEKAVISNSTIEKIVSKLLEFFLKILDIVRNSLYFDELKEEFYLHLMTYKPRSTHIFPLLLHFLPVVTMYLKPPIAIQRYLAAWIISHQNIDILQYPLCMATNFNIHSQQNVTNTDNSFVERQWIPGEKMFAELFQKQGAVTIQIEFLQKKKISIVIAESKTIGELLNKIIQKGEILLQDREHFWLYRYDKQSQEHTPFQGREHIGQILISDEQKSMIIMLKRRIYCRQLKYNYERYGINMINNLYYDIKFQYLVKNFFDNSRYIAEVTSIIFLVEEMQKYQQLVIQHKQLSIVNKSAAKGPPSIQKILNDKLNAIESIIHMYIPRKIYNKILKSKQTTIEAIKNKISERIERKQYSNVDGLKLQLLQIFKKCPEFMSSNYNVSSKQKAEMRLSINVMRIFIVYEDYRDNFKIVQLQKIVAVVPKAKYLLITYHRHENIVEEMHIFTQQKIIFAIAMDIFSYCSLRMKMSSINLHEIHHLQQLQVKIIELQEYRKRQYDKNIEKLLLRSKEERQISLRKISKISLSLMKLIQLPYENRNRYIKSQINRKLYANKIDRRQHQKQGNMYISQPQEEDLSINQINDLIFPFIKVQKQNQIDESLLKDYQELQMEQGTNNKTKQQQYLTTIKNQDNMNNTTNMYSHNLSSDKIETNSKEKNQGYIKEGASVVEKEGQDDEGGVVAGKRNNRNVNRRKNR